MADGIAEDLNAITLNIKEMRERGERQSERSRWRDSCEFNCWEGETHD